MFDGVDWSLDAKAEKVKPEMAQATEMAKRAVVEQNRFDDATSSGFYCTLVFQSASQCDAFVEAMKWQDSQDDEDPCYIDGVKVSQQMGIVLPETPPLRAEQSRKRWQRLAE
jgi:hypothetical protein